jgi:hypothetical protein
MLCDNRITLPSSPHRAAEADSIHKQLVECSPPESISCGARHAGILLVLSLVALRYVDEAQLSDGWKWYARSSIPCAAIFLPAAFFFSVLSPHATAPNRFIYLAYVGAVVLASGLVTLGVGLLRSKV